MQGEMEQFRAKLSLPILTSPAVPVNYHMHIRWPANTRTQCCQKEHGFMRQKNERAAKED